MLRTFVRFIYKLLRNWRGGKKFLVAVFIIIFATIDIGPAMIDLATRLAGTVFQERNIVDKIYLARKNPNVVDNFRFGPQKTEAALDPAELEYMVNIGPIVGSTAANYVYAAFFNPTGSGRTAVVKRIAVRANAVAAANWVNLTVRRITAVTTAGTLISATDIPRKNTDSVNPVMIVRHTGPGVTLDGTAFSRIMSQAMPGAAGEFHSVRDITFGTGDESIILQPGQGIALFQEAAGSVNHRVMMYVEWEEVTVAPTPQNEFLFAFPRVENAGAANWVYNSFFNPGASGRTAIIKRIWFGSETCDAASVYPNNLVIRRISSASAGTGIPSADIPRKHTGSAASNMDLRHTNVTVGLVGGADSRLGHVTPCGATNQPHGWMQIDFHVNDEKLILQPGQGIAFITEATGDVDQLNRMVLEWEEVAVANTPASRGEYIFATGRTEVAAVLGTTFHTFFNPVGSGRTAVVNRLVIRVDADAAATYSTFNFQRISAASAGILVTAADIPVKHTSSTASIMEIRHCGPACATAITATYVGHRDIAAGGMANSGILKVDGPGAIGQIIGHREIVFGANEKFILQPGEGLGFYLNRAAGSVEQYVKTLIEWGEVATAPPSRNQYLIDVGSVGGSTVAAFNYVSFFNPAASGRTTIVNRVSVRVDTVAGALYIPLRLRRITTASGGTGIALADIPRKHTGTANSAMDIRHTGPAVTFLQGIDGSLINVETPGAVGAATAPAINGWREILFATDERIILQPGQGIALGQTAVGDVDFRVKMLIEWEEVSSAATPASQGEFLMTTEPATGSLIDGFVYASFFNPVGSGRNYVVTRIGIRANRSGALTAPGFIPITLRRITSASGPAPVLVADLPRKHTGTATSTAEVRRAGVTVALAGVTDSRLLSVVAPGAVVQSIGILESEIIHGDELILAPGQGIALYQESPAGDTLIRYMISFQWRETAFAAPFVSQSAFRWRIDDGTETTASWRVAENTAITDVAPAEAIRLRMEIEESNSFASMVNARLEFSSDATSCTDGTWTALDSTTTAWRINGSPNITNASSTTNQLITSTRTFVAGRIFDAQNQDTTGVSLNNSHTEWEWAIRGHSTVEDTTIRFRVTNAGVVLDNYANCAQLTMAQRVITIDPRLTNPAVLPTGNGRDLYFSSDNRFLAVAHDVSPFFSVYNFDPMAGTIGARLANPAVLPTATVFSISFSPNDRFLAVAHIDSPFLSVYHFDPVAGTIGARLANPAVLPAGFGYGVSFSANNRFLAVAHDVSPFLSVYHFDPIAGTIGARLANPAVLPGGTPSDISFSPNDRFLAITYSSGSFLTVYNFNPVAGTIGARLANPAVLPTGMAFSVSFSPDNRFLAVAHATTPFLSVYNFNPVAGTIGARLANPVVLPTDDGQGVHFSPNNRFLAVAHDASPFLSVYNFDPVGGTIRTRLDNPSVPPTGIGRAVLFSPNNRFLAVAHITSPFFSVYHFGPHPEPIGARLANPAVLPAGNGSELSFSPDNRFLAIAHSTTPFLSVYHFNSIAGTIGTRLANPAVLPAGTGNDVNFSPDGRFLAVAHATTPFLSVYNFDPVAGTIGARLANPAVLPAGTGWGVSFSPDNRFLAIAHSTTPFLSVYHFNSIAGTIGTRLANPAALPATLGASVHFSPDNRFLAVAQGGSPFLSVYPFDPIAGTIGARLTDPAVLPAGAGESISFSADNRFLALSHATSPFLSVYHFNSVAGTIGTRLTNPATLPAGTGWGVSFSSDNRFLGVAHTGTPFISVYNFNSITGVIGTRLTNPVVLPAGIANGIPFSPDNRFLAVSHEVTPFLSVYRAEFAPSPFINQSAFRWRNDDGTETTATWRADENTAITDVSTTGIVRLRMEIAETNSIADMVNARLEFSSDATACTGGTWTALDMTTTAWRITDSAHITNAAATTNQLISSTNAFVAGRIFDTQNQDTVGISINNQNTEWEWAIRGDGAAANTAFRFRVTNAGTVLNAHTNCAQLTTADVGQTLTFSISDNAIGFGNIPVAAVRYATHDGLGSSTVPGPGFPVRLSVSTNAIAGLNISVRSLNAGLSGPVLIPAVASSAVAAGTPGYGVFGKNVNLLTIAAGFNNDGVGDVAVTTSDQVLTSIAAPVTNGGVDLALRSAVSPLTPSGSYSDSLTVIVTANF